MNRNNDRRRFHARKHVSALRRMDNRPAGRILLRELMELMGILGAEPPAGKEQK